jgi:threonine/homoserine/homoserine lactone efflux protein
MVVYYGSFQFVTLSGRADGTYYYRVKATSNGYLDSAWTNTLTGCSVLIPKAPSWLSVPLNSSDGTINIAWPASSSLGAKYILEESIDPNFQGAEIVYSSTSTNTTLYDRIAGSYYYRIKTQVTGYGDSAYSISGNSCTVLGLVPPNWISVPTGSNDGTLSISWATVPTPGILYVLQEATDPEFSNAVSLYIGSATSRTLTGRNSGTYYYRVQTRVSGVGSSSFVSASNSCAVVGLVPPNWISVPTGSNDGTFSISWAMVPTPGVLYVLQEATDPEFSNAVSLYIGSATSRTLTGRNAGTYYYRVQTRVSGIGSSSFVSASNSCAVVGLVPPNWVSVPTGSNDGTFGVSWAVVPTPGILYVLQEATDPGFTDAVSLYTGSATNRTLTGRNAGIYYYRVQTRVSGIGSSSFVSASNSCAVVGLVPPNWVSVPTESNDGTIGVSWAVVPTPGILYVLQEATDPGFSDAVSLYTGSSTNRTITGRNSGTYYYRVQTRVSGVGSSLFRDGSNNCIVSLP